MEVSGIIVSVIVYSIVLGIAFYGITYMEGWHIQPRLQISLKEFSFQNTTGYVLFKFESSEGAFTTGNPIHVNATVFHPYPTDDLNYFLFFPNTLSNEEYNNLSGRSTWETKNTIYGLIIPGAFTAQHLKKLTMTNNPTNISWPSTEYDSVWTQEGPQDVYLFVSKTGPVDKFGKIQLGNGTKFINIINIQPTDILQNMKTNNSLAGLTFVIISLTIATAYSQYDRLFIHLKWRR